MKKTLYALLILLLQVIFVSDVYAASMNMSLTGPDEIDKQITLTLEITSIEDYEGFYGIMANLNYDHDKLDLTSISGLNNFDLTHNAKTNKIVVYKATGAREKTSIVSMKFLNIGLTKDEKTTITLSNVTVSDSIKDIELSDISKIITSTTSDKPVLEDTSLSSITINGKEVTLDDDNLNYDIVIANGIDKITIDAKSNNGNATIDGNGEYILEEGNNKIDIKVTGEDGVERTYTINVNREDAETDGTSDDLFLTSDGKKDNHILKIIIPIVVIILLTVIIIIFKRKDKR